MDCNNPKCCELQRVAQEQIREFCESRVYSDRESCILYVVDGSSSLYTVDPQTGAMTLVGPTGYGGVTDITWDGSNLYGITGSQLIQINTTTGAGTLIGNHGTGCNALDADNAGNLYALSSNLYLINKTTAAATLIGPLGSGLSSAGDLAFDASGNLYASFTNGNLGRVNVSTGAGVNVGPFGFSAVWGLDWCDGILYAITASGQLLNVNPSTGAGTLLFNTGISNVWGMTAAKIGAPIPCEPAPLPDLEPIFTVKYGDEPGDTIGTTDAECICITACNPYNNVTFRHVTLMVSQVFDPNGDPVDPKNLIFKPGRLVCFGDLGPCEKQDEGCGCSADSCSSREFIVVTNEAKEGLYTFTFEYCFSVEYCLKRDHRFELEVRD